MSSSKRYLWFDLIRGLSALLVCADHLKNAIIVDFGQVHSPGILHKIFYFCAGFGHQAVMVFFVLSGFFVGGSVLSKESSFKFSNYLEARITRLWIVLVPALLLTACVDTFTGLVNPEALVGGLNAMWNSGPPLDGAHSLGIIRFIENCLFLQTVTTPVYGSNAPLWSLANEFWYYLLFPLLMFAGGVCGTPSTFIKRALLLLLSIAILVFLPWKISSLFWIWLLGALLWWINAKRRLPESRALVIVSFGCFLGSLVYSQLPVLQAALKVGPDTLIGLTFFLFALSLINFPFPSGYRDLQKRLALGLSEISYSLYLFHFPIVLLISVYFYDGQQIQPTMSAIVQFFGWFLLIIAGSAIFWWLFESRTKELRALVRKIKSLGRPRREQVEV